MRFGYGICFCIWGLVGVIVCRVRDGRVTATHSMCAKRWMLLGLVVVSKLLMDAEMVMGHTKPVRGETRNL